MNIQKLRVKLADIWEDIDIWFYNHITSNIRYFIERVIGTYTYARFIWKSNAYREWDYAYLYDIIEFKLRRIAKRLRADDFVVGSEENYNAIMATLKHLEEYNDYEDKVKPDRTKEEIIADIDKQQEHWNNFHNAMRDQAQGWWS